MISTKLKDFATFKGATSLATGPNSRDTVVFISGWPDDAHSVWKSQTDALEGEKHMCMVVDLPNYGITAPKSAWGFSSDEVVDYLRQEVLRAGKGEPVHLVTHDWGSVYGLLLEAKYPELCKTFTALDVGGALSCTFGQSLFIFLYQAWLILAFLINGTIGAWMTSAFANYAKAPRSDRKLTSSLNYPYARFWFEAIWPFGSGFPFRLLRSKLMPDCPVLFMYGAKSSTAGFFFAESWAREVAEKEDSFVVPIEADHWLQVRAAEDVSQVLTAFLSDDQESKELLRDRCWRPKESPLPITNSNIFFK